MAHTLDRRRLVGGVGGLAIGWLGGSTSPAQAQERPPTDLFVAARAQLAGSRVIREARVTVDIPRLAENGTAVPLRISVDSPMSAEDHVRTIHILSEQNPIATIGRFHLGPRSGRAEVHTVVRLATTQNVHAIAEMSDGSLWSGRAETVVMLAACLEG